LTSHSAVESRRNDEQDEQAAQFANVSPHSNNASSQTLKPL